MKRLPAAVLVSWIVLGCGASRSERVDVAGHSLDIVFDDAFVAQAGPRIGEARAAANHWVTKGLGDFNARFPAAFAREAPRLVRFDVHHRAQIELVAVLDDPRAELVCPQQDITEALGQDFRRTVEPRFRGREPEQIASAEGADWFDWARLGGVPGNAVIGAVARFAVAPGASDQALARHARAWLVDQADDISRSGFALAPSPAQVALRQPYVRWLLTAAPLLDADQRLALVPALFRLPPRPQDIDYGYAPAEPRTYWHFDGFDVFAFGLANADAWIAAGQTNAMRAWIQSSLATDGGTARLAEALGARTDTRLVDGVLSALGSDRTRTEALLRALEPYPRTLSAARAHRAGGT